MSINPTGGRAASTTAPSDRFVSVTPNDAADLPGGPCRALFVGVAGEVALRDRHGNDVVFASAASQYHPVCAVRVMATGTTAAGLVALY
jgi:hypothetical protein